MSEILFLRRAPRVRLDFDLHACQAPEQMEHDSEAKYGRKIEKIHKIYKELSYYSIHTLHTLKSVAVLVAQSEKVCYCNHSLHGWVLSVIRLSSW